MCGLIGVSGVVLKPATSNPEAGLGLRHARDLPLAAGAARDRPAHQEV